MPEPFRNLLIVDDEAAMRHMLRLVLEPHNYRISEAENGAAALALIRREKFTAILSDIRMPDMDGLRFLNQPEVRNLDSTIIMMSAYGGIDTALECMKRGAYDYISKPFKPDEVLLTLRKAEERQQLQLENSRLKTALGKQTSAFNLEQIVHSSETMARILHTVRTVAKADSPVLISGETGTGKELIAKGLHSESGRRGPFLAINCSAISPGLLESELFGHSKGAFTGADREKQGLFSTASGGTLFLDEIAELPLELQPKLLRVLQEREIRKVGATRSEIIDTRVVAAAGTDLLSAVETHRFRNDLYYRLAVVEIHLPPLRNRREDIPLLAEHIISRIAEREGVEIPQLSSAARQLLTDYHWPGNVRELQNFLEKAMIFNRDAILELPPLPKAERRYLPEGTDDELSLKIAARRLEEDYIRRALIHTDGNRTQAAIILEISLRSLMYKIKEYHLE
jgi:two-component system response regulator AtoC